MSPIICFKRLCLFATLLVPCLTQADGLDIGDMAPDFSLQGSDGQRHQLRDYRGTMVVVAWYPKAFTGG